MKTRLLNISFWLRRSYWFVPALMVVGGTALSVLTLALDRVVPMPHGRWAVWLYGGGPDGAGTLLSTLAGSMVTVAGVTFSMTLVALSQAAAQYGPRLLISFRRDTGSQVVLGTFVTTFIYCLLVLRTVTGAGERPFVPHLSTNVAVGLAAASVAVLIYFIHHLSDLLHVDHLVAVVALDLDAAVEHLVPAGQAGGRDAPVELPAEEGRSVTATKTGYAEAFDEAGLVELAARRDLVVRLDRHAGSFLVAGQGVATVWPADAVDEEVTAAVNRATIVGTRRTPEQDIKFVVDQLVEVAVRALSPGVNDPYTATSAVDRLGSSLVRLLSRGVPSPGRHDRGGRLRLVVAPLDLGGIVDAAFNQVRWAARTNPGVVMHLLATIASIAPHVRRDEARAALRRQADAIASPSEAISYPADRQAIEHWHAIAIRALGELADVAPR